MQGRRKPTGGGEARPDLNDDVCAQSDRVRAAEESRCRDEGGGCFGKGRTHHLGVSRLNGVWETGRPGFVK